MVVVIVVERNSVVVALDEASAGRVVVIGRERKSRVIGERIDRLNQSLAEGNFADDDRAVVVLERSGDDFPPPTPCRD